MKHIYLILIGTVFFLSSFSGYTQEVNDNISAASDHIEGLSLYPNPVKHSTSTIFITSKSGALKKVSIYNVLGKQIAQSVSITKELDISALNSGVYILKISEGLVTETRKLVIK